MKLFLSFNLLWMIGIMTNCTKPGSSTLYYYDWKAMGVKAPSVLPELEYKSVKFTIKELERVEPFESPKVLAPYNISMMFDTLIRGNIDGREATIQTSSELLKQNPPLSPGTVLALSIGKKTPAHVYSLGE